MENLQLQKTKYYVLGILLSLLSACSSGTEKTDSGQSSNPDQEIPSISSYEDNFIGEWKSVQSEKRNHTKISRNGDNFIIEEGEKTMPGVWDEDKRVIQVNIGVPMDIMYIEKEDMILIAGAGKYSRVPKKQ